MQRASGDQSLREDIPLDGVLPGNLREEGRKYIVLGSQDNYQEILDDAMRVSREALASVGK